MKMNLDYLLSFLFPTRTNFPIIIALQKANKAEDMFILCKSCFEVPHGQEFIIIKTHASKEDFDLVMKAVDQMQKRLGAILGVK